MDISVGDSTELQSRSNKVKRTENFEANEEEEAEASLNRI
jgi:hypothetical protein